MKVSNREFSLILGCALLFAACFIAFGMLIGQTSLSKVGNWQLYTTWLSSVGSILAGLGTIGLFVFGLKAISTWRVQKQSEHLIKLKSSLVLATHKAREWIREACICSYPPEYDLKAQKIKKELDTCLVTLIEQAANCDATSTNRESWYIDDIHGIKLFITDTIAFANALNHYPQGIEPDNKPPSFWDRNVIINRRNNSLIERSDKLKTKTINLLNQLDQRENHIGGL
ncbi:TPA: hypothetical protein RQJ43_001085 [Vibrio vulnificus]|nr:hypothetical protein [Vibrio vulnificus]HAV6898317.1 hypothetical protein [Vibrio vulnificus]HDY7435343.1 hypothetical protein [Vibrio vulnificus]